MTAKTPPPAPMIVRVSRRRFLRGAACAVGAAGVIGAAESCATKPPSPGTKPKAEAEYQDKPHGLARCGLCKHFYSPDICEIVAGPVSPQGWCKYYALL